MNLASILHKPLSEYAFAIDNNTYIFRLRTGKGECDDVRFGYADRAAMSPKLSFETVQMKKINTDKYYDWYEVVLKTEFERIAYYFELKDKEETKYYLGDAFEDSFDTDRSDYFQLPFNHRADRIEVPEWVKEAMVYNIFPDSFADGRRTISGKPSSKEYKGITCSSNLGGTINGIRENLDYIKGMGFNCIYLNPFFVADSYHKYDLIDYFHVDPTRGTDEDFRELVKAAHENGIRVIIDGVFNHISSNHEFFKDVLEKGEDSEYYKCFYNLGPKPIRFPKTGEDLSYTCFAYVPEMPKTDTSNEWLKNYFVGVGEFWVKEYDVDGWRLDVANEVDDGFLRAFFTKVKEAKSDAIVIGEVWENASHYVNSHMMDGAMNYDFRRHLSAYIAKRRIDGEEFLARMNGMFMRYSRQSVNAQLNLLDSHDVSRFFSLCEGNIDKVELSIVLLMTMPGMPCVFYGDEHGIMGLTEPEYRQAMNFTDNDNLCSIYKKLIKIRKESDRNSRGFLSVSGGSINIEGCHFGVYINAEDTPVNIESVEGTVLLQKNYECGILEPMGYIITKM